MSVDTGLLVLRVALGLFMLGHGTQKLFGWFGGGGFARTAGFMASMGLKPASLWALLGVLGEVGGGLALAFGFLSPLAAVGIVAAMLFAVIKVHWSSGFWGTKGGYEYPLMLLILSFVLGLIGPGAYSLDAVLGIVLPVYVFWAGLILSVLVVGGGIVASNRETAKQVTA